MRCKVCKEKFVQKFFNQKWCSPECGAKYAMMLKEKSDRRIKSAVRETLKTHTQRVNEAKKVFQAWIRERDKDLPCISCGTLTATWHGGHYKKAELYRGVIFHEWNCWKQCLKCNNYLNGNEANYRVRLVGRIGEQAVVELEELAEKTRTRKYTTEELNEIKAKYRIGKVQT